MAQVGHLIDPADSVAHAREIKTETETERERKRERQTDRKRLIDLADSVAHAKFLISNQFLFAFLLCFTLPPANSVAHKAFPSTSC